MNQLRQTIEQGRADQQPRHDLGPVRLRQGDWWRALIHALSARASGPFVALNAADDHARAHGDRAVRHRSRTAASARSARSRRRMAARSISTRSPTCRARRRARSCACWSISSSSGSAAPSGSRSTSASSPRPRRTSKAMIAEGRFREDSSIGWPSCRSRVPGARRAARGHPVAGRPLHAPDRASRPASGRAASATMRMAVLQAHDWPGNVRQLRNNIERLMILARGDDVGRADHRRHAAGRDRRHAAAQRPASRTSTSWRCRCAKRARCSSANI